MAALYHKSLNLVNHPSFVKLISNKKYSTNDMNRVLNKFTNTSIRSASTGIWNSQLVSYIDLRNNIYNFLVLDLFCNSELLT